MKEGIRTGYLCERTQQGLVLTCYVSGEREEWRKLGWDSSKWVACAPNSWWVLPEAAGKSRFYVSIWKQGTYGQEQLKDPHPLPISARALPGTPSASERDARTQRESPGCWSHRCRKLPRFADWKQDWKELHWSHKVGGRSCFPVHMVSVDSWWMLTSTWTLAHAGLAPTSLCQGRVTKARAERELLALRLQCKIALGPMIIHMYSACSACIQVSHSCTRREGLSKHFCNLLTYTLPL